MNFIIFDLEATCWKEGKIHFSEIIEIGAVKYNDKAEKIDSFSKFIRPVIKPVLSDFCTELTSITQDQVNQADSFEVVIGEFTDWILNDEPDNVLLSWGKYDKSQILRECRKKNVESSDIAKLLDSHINLKERFAQIKRVKPCGMQKALKILHLRLDGTHHRGIDDAHNIGKIFNKLFSQLF